MPMGQVAQFYEVLSLWPLAMLVRTVDKLLVADDNQ